MFYSQFILAKKGPLGTIWIAAHLERKLRKNQVADTDIGVSVDSIIFPEVPIALRLSSHLLLGVARIYSRKVNYLFDDCSDALLKIKQAFRSTAVDLPPEESTAPYHSITLPETFDLDDFELPDSEIFQGNYVDHHVSAKEQITLQDTMDGVVYSSSQFGLDERFGDGDTSQIGLDLNEDALLGKASTLMNNGSLDDDVQASLPPLTPFEADDNNDCSTSDASRTTLKNYSGDQVEILDNRPESSEYANAPDTHVLAEEANLSIVRGTLVSDDHLESEAHNHGEMAIKQAKTRGYSELAAEYVDHVSANGSLCSPSCSVSQCPNGFMEVLEGAVDSIDGKSMCIDSQTETQTTEKLEAKPDEIAAPSSCSPVSLELNKQSPAMCDASEEKTDTPKKSAEDAVCQLGSCHLPGVADGLEVHDELKDHETGSLLQKDMQSKFMKGLQPCNSNIGHQDKSLLEVDERCPAADVIGVTSNENQILEPALKKKAQPDFGELLDQFYNEALKNQSGNDNSDVILDLPAPEKLLSASDFHADKPNDLLVEPPPDKESLEQGIKQISGRKRSSTESAATMQSNSFESFGLSQSKRTVESVPDDDDLLSSILVGRGSSVLKMKPTPVPLEAISSKRPRTGQRASALKRKVLMDESMVLLGDMIRQQLMSTQDLRRERKKAPCTLSEISMIQRRFLEDEIFREPTLAGLSAELFYMHKETNDVSKTKICELDKATAPAEATKHSIDKVIRDDGEVQAIETLPQDWSHQDEKYATDACITESTVLVDAMEVDGWRAEGADAVSQPAVSELDMQVPINLIHDDTCNRLDNLSSKERLMVKTDDDGASHLFPQHSFNEQSLGKDSAEANVLTEEVDAVSELCVHELVAEAGSHPGIGRLDDAEINCPMENFIFPRDHGDISCGTASAAPEEHDSLMLVQNNDDAERFGSMGAECEADFQSSSVLKDNLGHPVEHEGNTNYMSLIDDEGARFHEDWGPGDRDLEAIYGHHVEDLENTAIGNDTEFLNVDDDEVDEDNEHLSDTEDSRLLDNSGWSSRTRAVAKYLQALFDREAVRGKSILPMDSLLAGKTRKEVSRMFFESLVLKTRDYIQVEQVKPFDNIDMRPRPKLMKSQF